jgi:hypothetical protein
MNKILFLVFTSLWLVACIPPTIPTATPTTATPTTATVTDTKLSNIFIYDNTGPYATKLVACAQVNTILKSCSLETLPLIGLESGEISVQKIMQRVVTSHQWMGDRFKKLLEIMPVETLALFNSVTMIVLDDDTRPSFYWSLTGALYIDPSFLWLTNQEKVNVTKKSDYRNDYGKDLMLVSLWRFVKNNKIAYKYYSLDDDKERDIDDIKIAFFRLIFHELAHANDFAPSSSLNLLDKTNSIYEALSNNFNNRISNILYQSYPLQSSELNSIGQVLYQGKTATDEIKNLTAEYAGSLMHNDGANNIYSYSTQYEDLAELFEATLMKKYFDIDLDVGFTNNPADSNSTCSDYTIGWASRNRIANSLVKIRAKQVAQKILTKVDWDDFFNDEVNGVGFEVLLKTGVDWCSILDYEESSERILNKSSNHIFNKSYEIY